MPFLNLVEPFAEMLLFNILWVIGKAMNSLKILSA
jgi:hypothetical protein